MFVISLIHVTTNLSNYLDNINKNSGRYVVENAGINTKYSDFGLGGGLGYKMYIKDAWAFEFLVGFGSNLSNREKSPDVISIVGLNFGHRF